MRTAVIVQGGIVRGLPGSESRVAPLDISLHRLEDLACELLRDPLTYRPALDHDDAALGLDGYVPAISCDAFRPVFERGSRLLMVAMARRENRGDRRTIDKSLSIDVSP
jgi:hypothetical protein